MSSSRKISHYAIMFGVWSCLLGAIWYPQDALKWIGTSVYLAFVGRYLGLTFRNQKIVGRRLHRVKDKITNFLPMRKP